MENFSIDIPDASRWIILGIMVFYILMVTLFGGYFSRFNSSINDFFYSGQRFSWWLPAVSMFATGVGSYSYLKYSEQGLRTGMSSSLLYMNEWFIVPFFMFGWLPILYFSKVRTIPEYFERRFGRTARILSMLTILCYMFYYIGYNLFTIGVAFEGMLGLPLIPTTMFVAAFLGAYVTVSGQTGVIFTDLAQGVMLFLAGAIAIVSGLYMLGGVGEFWAWLPVDFRSPFNALNSVPKYNTSSIYWGDALAGSIAFTFMNQGFIMRYLSMKSIHDTRKAIVFNIVVTLPIAACVVGAVGWIAKSILVKQAALGGALEPYNLIEIHNTFHTFLVVTWESLKQNAVIFGFVIAALMAALMSTVDTLINACAAVAVYDLYKPYVSTNASEKHYLLMARVASVVVTLLGGSLVFWFSTQKGSLMDIHYKGIMTIIPPIVVTIFMGILWPRFSSRAAVCSMALGSVVTVVSNWYPAWIDPVSAFVLGPSGPYTLMRSLFGMAFTAFVGVLICLLDTSKEDKARTQGLTIFSLDKAMESYKGSRPHHAVGDEVRGLVIKIDNKLPDSKVRLNPKNLKKLKAHEGDMLYVSDDRKWLGGLRSDHVYAVSGTDVPEHVLEISSRSLRSAYLIKKNPVLVEKIL